MSAETKAALDSALEAHIRDETESEAIVTGYVLHASHVTGESFGNGSTGYFAEYAEHQPFHVCVGLAHQLVHELSFGYTNDDDE